MSELSTEALRHQADIVARSDDPDTATALRWAANDIDSLRAALAAAQAAGATTLPLTPAGEAVAAEIGRTIQWQQGFAAGVEAVADWMFANPWLQGVAWNTYVAAIRALRPPAAPAESKQMPDALVNDGSVNDGGDRAQLRAKPPSPLSASEPAGAPSGPITTELGRKIVEVDSTGLVFQKWMFTLPMQQQSVLVLACRGPDGVGKFHPTKLVVCRYRATVLKAAYLGRPMGIDEGDDTTFMTLLQFSDDAHWQEIVRTFFDHIDEIEHHYFMHLAHGAEIIGYKHPGELFRRRWLSFYHACCHNLHLFPEDEAELDSRLADWHREHWDWLKLKQESR